jgi:hypothetical protein
MQVGLAEILPVQVEQILEGEAVLVTGHLLPVALEVLV